MAYDRSDPADLLQLKTEVNTDPLGMGYNPSGSTAQLLKLLNDAAENLGGETVARTFDAEAMHDALDPSEFDAQQTAAGAPEYVAALTSAQFDISGLKSKFRSMFAGNSATVTALDAQTTALSRAEVLFGQGTNISREDWFAARDSV